MQKTKTKPLDKKAVLKDTVERTITLTLPRKLDEQLQTIAKALDRSVESIILEEAYSVFSNFFQGGFADGWREYLIDDADGKSLDEQVEKIADIVLDC